MYDYTTPAGYGDTFFIYNVNGEDIPVVDGNSYTLLGVEVNDGMFVCRVWTGGILVVNKVTGTVQMYDGVKCAWFQQPLIQGGIFPPSFAVLPEKVYRDTSAIRFDLADVALNVNSNGTASVYADQMAWYGVRRVQNGPSDPLPSLYKYYEKPFSYPITFALNNFGPSDVVGNPIPGLSAPTQYSILIQDFDFELRRISTSITGQGTFATLLLTELTEIFVGRFTAVTEGVGGNSIEIVIVVAGINTVLSVGVVGNVITVNLATDGSGNSTSLSSDIINAVNGDVAAAALVVATTLVPFQLIPDSVSGFLSGGSGGATAPYASPFKIWLYDATWRQRSLIPILSELLCHNPSTTPPPSSMPNNAWPSPPLMYPVNSVIRFDIFSLIPTGDGLPTINLNFEGIRRIAC